MISVCDDKSGILLAQARGAVEEFFAANDYSGKRLLLLLPDNTRSGPIGEIFQMIFECIGAKVEAIDILIALGTHMPLNEEQICRRLCISQQQRQSKYKKVKFFNHEWDKPETFVKAGVIEADRIEEISGGLFREQVEVSVNKLIFDYDEFFIVGPVFPHEVVGFSGGHKYIFPGIAGEKIINFFHWLGAVITNPWINGNKWTATRKVVEAAADMIDVPRKLFGVVAAKEKLYGVFIGECVEAWEAAADLSAKVHMVYKDKPFKTVLGIAPKMYDDIWTAGKVMYKLEPIVADGGKLIIYAPHIDEISYTHGKIIDKAGYHVRDYFRKQWDDFKGYPRGVLAHCTHVKGIGRYENGVEKPRVEVVLATAVSSERCRQVNLGYMDPADIRISDYENREDEGVLVVHEAGEMLHRLSSGYIPTIEDK